MPFTTLEAKSDESFYFIPDVSGDPAAITFLMNSNHTVHAWTDPRLKNSFKNKALPELASEIVTAIKQKVAEKKDNKRVNVAGYSLGGVIAALVTQQLKKDNIPVSLCIIDAPSPLKSQQYLTKNNLKATGDLVSIIKYIITLAGLPRMEDVSESETMSWSKLEVMDQIQQIYAYALSKIPNLASRDIENILRFHQYYRIVNFNLLNLMNCVIDLNQPLADYTVILMIKNTCEKYNCSLKGGWEQYNLGAGYCYQLYGDHQSIVSNDGSGQLRERLGILISATSTEPLDKFFIRIPAESKKEKSTQDQDGDVEMDTEKTAKTSVAKLGNWSTKRHTRSDSRRIQEQLGMHAVQEHTERKSSSGRGKSHS